MLIARTLKCLSFLLVIAYSNVSSQPFSGLIVFGDSLSDTGNLAGVITPNLPPPYVDNRISNGPLAVDVFASSINQNANAAAAGGTNYAVVGGNILGSDFEDLTSQINRYLGDTSGRADSDAVYLVFIGGNDLRGLRGQPNTKVAAQQIDMILATLKQQVDRLMDAGAVNIIVSNVADIGRIPETLKRELEQPGISARTSSYVELFNLGLAKQLALLAAESTINVFDFDAFSVLSNILDSPAQFGFLRVDVGCFDLDGFDFHPDCDSGLFPLLPARFERFVFFDNLHLTSEAHTLVGNALTRRVDQPPLARLAADRRMKVIGPILLLLMDDM